MNWRVKPVDQTVEIPLRDRGGRVVATALVDQQDRHLAQVRWYRLRNGYAVRTEIRGGKKRMVYMHRAVRSLTSRDSAVVDHLNGDKLDNRRANLRVVTPKRNSSNRGANRSRSLPRNVYPAHTRDDAFRVQVKVQGKAMHIGTFDSLPEAEAAARDARIRFGVASARDHQVAAAAAALGVR